MSDSPTLIPLAEQRVAVSSLRRLITPARSGKGRLLMLVGPAGCGKSALIRQMLRQRAAENSKLDLEGTQSAKPPDVIAVTASEFAAGLAEASDADQVPELQQRFRAPSLLVCEDLQAISGRTQSLLQLLAILDDLLAHGSDVIVTSTRLPGQLERFPIKLVNRLRGGTVITIPLPGPDSRASLLRHFAAECPLAIPRDGLALLAESLPVSPRELAGVVTQLAAEPKPLRRETVEAFLKRSPAKSITPQAVTRAVAAEFGVTQSALRSSRRAAMLVLPRQFAMWLCRNVCQMSLPAIGEHFERQHSSVLHAVRKLDEQLRKDPRLRLRLSKIQRALK